MPVTDNIRLMIKQRLGPLVSFNVSMSAYTTMRVGGPADVIVTPRQADEIAWLLSLLSDEGIPWFVVGRGSNLIVTDKGIRGVVINLGPGFSGIEILKRSGNRIWIKASAGAGLQELCRFCMEAGASGFGFAWGIPASVGGAIAMNAGAESGCMADRIDRLRLVTSAGKITGYEARDLEFSYRCLKIPGIGVEPGMPGGPVILDAVFECRKTDPGILEDERGKALEKRYSRQPSGFSAGCIFKNPPGTRGAGYLIEAAGMKGYSIGDAQVSDLHANFILNRGKARSADVIELIRKIAEAVESKFGIILEPEVRIVGEP